MFNERFIRIVIWIVAVILPGGLALLAVWESVRALRARATVRSRSSVAVRRLPPQALGT